MLISKYKLSGVAAKSSMLLLVVISSVAAILFNNSQDTLGYIKNIARIL
jgi:hypothetical protein